MTCAASILIGMRPHLAPMQRILIASTESGPTLLAGGVVVGLVWPWLAEQARPAMPCAIFVLVLGTLLRVDPRQIGVTLRQPSAVAALPMLCMVGAPLLVGGLAHQAGLSQELSLALVLAVAAPPSSGNASIARMLGLDDTLALVATFASMAIAPVTVPLAAALAGGVGVDPLALAWRLATLIGSAGGLALLLRRHAAATLSKQGAAIDAIVLAALLLFALSTMAGIQARILAGPLEALGCLALAFAVNVGLQTLGALLPGAAERRASAGLVMGNRNVGLVWSVLGTSVSPLMALYFAATQLPIYTLPRLLQFALSRRSARLSPKKSIQSNGEP